MSRAPVADQQPDFAGGLNAIASAVALAPNQVSQATNARLTQFGGITKRGGTQRLTSAVLHSSGVRGLSEWTLSTGTRYLLAVANGTLYRATYGSFPITFTSVAGSLSTTAYTDHVAFRDASGDAMYIVDGGQLNKLTVAAGPVFTLTTDIASTPSVSSVEVFNQRLWACGDSASPQSIFYSALNNGDTLGIGASAGGQIIVRTFGQANVVAVKALATSLLIFHRAGVSRLTGFGQDDTVAVPAGVTGEVGTTAPASIVRVGNVAYYVNVRGLFVATAEGVLPVTTPEKPDPLSIVLPTLTDDDVAAVSCVFNRATREVYVAVPTVGVYVYHTVLQSWSGPWDGAFNQSARMPMANVGTADDVPVTLRGGSDGYIELTDAPSTYMDHVTAAGSGGNGYVLSVALRRQFAADFTMAKSYRWGYVLADLAGSDDASLVWQTDLSGGTIPLAQSATSLMATEGGDTITTESGDIMVTATSVATLRVPVWGTGYYIDGIIRDESTTAIPTFSRVEITGFELGRR